MMLSSPFSMAVSTMATPLNMLTFDTGQSFTAYFNLN
jgi:hypothetical protein